MISNVTGNIVNVDDFKVHENEDGSVDKTKTDLYIHLVDRDDNSIVEVAQVLRVIDQNIEKLDGIFKVSKHIVLKNIVFFFNCYFFSIYYRASTCWIPSHRTG